MTELGKFVSELLDFYAQGIEEQRFKVGIRPELDDNTEDTGYDHHYVLHTAWAARQLYNTEIDSPHTHIDIGSDIRFVSIVSSFIPIDYYDIRPPDLRLPNLKVEHGDINKLPFDTCSIPSLSCMHVVEHIGLGRYGDKLDPNGDLKAIEELKRVLAVGGILLFVVPIGKPVCLFNSHRIYNYDQILSYFKELELLNFDLIKDKATEITYNATKEEADEQGYGCGCFRFTRARKTRKKGEREDV